MTNSIGQIINALLPAGISIRNLPKRITQRHSQFFDFVGLGIVVIRPLGPEQRHRVTVATDPCRICQNVIFHQEVPKLMGYREYALATRHDSAPIWCESLGELILG